MHKLGLAAVALSMAVAGAGPVAITASPQTVPPPTRTITNITGQLYRAQNNTHYNVFLVTSEGVIVTDPINREFARWLKQEIAQRFKQPVRYVMYSHHDWDHASGGAVFADTAEFVGHVSMASELAVPAGNLPLPPAMQKLDANGNGVLDRAEATGPAAATFQLTDANGDGLLTGAEVVRGPVNDVYPPTWTYTDRRTIALGGKTAVAIHIGTAHAPDSSVILFPAERAIYGADTIQVKRLPLSLGPHMGAWHDTLRTALAIDFDIVAPGHGMVGTKKDLAALHQYIADLTGGVAAGVAANRSLPEIQKTVMLEPYRTFERWDTHREAHIAEVYQTMKGTP
jgi:glyoxylase-like metal-dependent hydrolase (beta-lactamase superfamily II)